MSEHFAEISWKNIPNPVDEKTYNRNHQLSLSGNQQLEGSSAPEYKGDPDCVDPEQLLVSALASCHMLTFLAIAELKGYQVETYDDKATGYLEKGDSGRSEVTRIALFPRIAFSGDKSPDANEIKRMHASAHKNCFIANSIKTKVEVLEA